MRRNQWWRQLLTQFCYDHRKIGSQICRIRHSAEELEKIMDVFPSEKNCKKKK